MAILIIAVCIVGYFVIFIAAMVALAALFFTFVAFWAWNKPRSLFGAIVTPEEARSYVGRGLIGILMGLPILRLICQWLGLPIYTHPDFPMYAGIIGYTFGSLILGLLIEKFKEAEDAQKLAQQQPEPPPAPGATLPPPAKPFDYASWDDEARR
ncbi:hypothetical protein [Roseococcus sp.]|uniref:hypothetical protein n=1 Tax=Roseococcus sp. TaxID=2109646 RepID=UPI003BAD4B0D